jgi:hypothetical protein
MRGDTAEICLEECGGSIVAFGQIFQTFKI